MECEMTYEIKNPFIKAQFSSRLRALRKAKRHTQKQAAELLNIDRKTYNRWESPTELRSYPKEPNSQIALCELYDCNLDWLIRGLYEKSREDMLNREYLNLYELYTSDEHFHWLIKQLMEMDKPVQAALCRFIEAFDDQYNGAPLFSL